MTRRAGFGLLTALVLGCGAAPGGVSLSPSPAVPAATTPSPLSATSAPAASSVAISIAAGDSWIVYQGGDGGPSRIRLVRPDGIDDHVLVDGLVSDNPKGEYQHPDWSPDGQQIAFSAEGANGTNDLWVANADGSGATKVLDCIDPCGYADHPAWSPDGTTLAFVSADRLDNGDSIAQVETIDLADGDRSTIIEATDNAWFYVPRWAPDGQRIVVEATRFATARFDEETATASTIGVVDLADARREFSPVLPWDSWATYPDWDPQGDRILFQQPTDSAKPFDSADIFVVDLARGEPQRLTTFGDDGGWAIQPAWTPDGLGVTFVAEDLVRSHPNYASIRADGTNLERFSDRYFRTHPRLRPT